MTLCITLNSFIFSQLSLCIMRTAENWFLIKSQNHLGQKSPLRLSSSVNPLLSSPSLTHIPQCHIHKYLNTFRTPPLPKTACSSLVNLLFKKKYKIPSIQCKPPLAKLETISSRLIQNIPMNKIPYPPCITLNSSFPTLPGLRKLLGHISISFKYILASLLT